MDYIRIITPVLAAWLVAAPPEPAQGEWQLAQRRPGMTRERAAEPARESDAISPSGLEPVFPAGAVCPEIASPYGSQTRYDGSRRPPWQFGGYHGGIDISLDEGTQILAVAAGTVVSKGEGGQLEGIYLWLRHTPEDTGLSYWLYSKYQHLESLPELSIGAKVSAGQVVGRSGKTGTVGGHYGFAGYPHLHLTARKSASGAYRKEGSGLPAPDSLLIDPLVIYHEAGAKAQKKEIAIPHATADGRLRPQGTRVVWPVACRQK
ncbi:MAG: M23 family metallopeptidase [Deltaproteobacteria bacterium]|nr:M23 family metallopeptidase [Deltaproteobacteria bacterium]